MIVVVPCWRRPEFLAACLRCLEGARGAEHQTYIFSIDHAYDRRVFEVLDEFVFPRRKTLISRGEHAYQGPAYNILNAYKFAFELARSDELIALIEDDVLVATDIFEFFEDALALDPDAFCVNACRNQNDRPVIHGSVSELDALIYRHQSYQSMAVAHRRASVEEFLRHATSEYFREPIAYCTRELPNHGLPDWASSQDGLIHRVIRGGHRNTLYPVTPRAFHAGWVGYNRSQGVELDLDWRLGRNKILSMTSDQMNALADPRFRDIATCALIRSRSLLKLV